MLGTVPFPLGFAATVHFHWPGKGFQLLGMLSNEKPSAVFRLRGTYTAAQHQSHSTISSATAAVNTAPDNVTAVLGIAVEPIPAVEAQIASSADSRVVKAGATGGGLSDPAVLAERVVKHLFTYLSSFVSDPGSLSPETVVPLNIIRRWYENFLTKIRSSGVGFLENQG
ncbi:hypothetical protein FRC10_007511 [Ceratobasidium sp. 414]|nr:hypothetical protein FRC10_007511 [Ceratobasidium sp. 414]